MTIKLGELSATDPRMLEVLLESLVELEVRLGLASAVAAEVVAVELQGCQK
jgi:hypothetical protein